MSFRGEVWYRRDGSLIVNPFFIGPNLFPSRFLWAINFLQASLLLLRSLFPFFIRIAYWSRRFHNFLLRLQLEWALHNDSDSSFDSLIGFYFRLHHWKCSLREMFWNVRWDGINSDLNIFDVEFFSKNLLIHGNISWIQEAKICIRSAFNDSNSDRSKWLSLSLSTCSSTAMQIWNNNRSKYVDQSIQSNLQSHEE